MWNGGYTLFFLRALLRMTGEPGKVPTFSVCPEVHSPEISFLLSSLITYESKSISSLSSLFQNIVIWKYATYFTVNSHQFACVSFCFIYFEVLSFGMFSFGILCLLSGLFLLWLCKVLFLWQFSWLWSLLDNVVTPAFCVLMFAWC